VQAIEPEAGDAQTPLTDAAQQPLNTDGQVAKSAVNTPAGISTETALVPGNNAAGSNPVFGNTAAAKKTLHSRGAESGSAAHESASELNTSEFNKSTPLKLVSRTPAAGVDPTLLAAYEAYSRGDDAAAQKQYRQVLQGDTRNVDALLGMAAIALRQSRYADANGWYQKVLEIEPRNSTALSAIANSQISSESAGSATADYAGSESRIKSMLAQQPEAANLHAALGNLYASQSQWSLAQAAYFNASRYAPNSADYAFNLAVSLDQLGKSGLALAQYQRALGLINNAGTGNLDKAQLEARIQALQ
jgi:tetratricopeptide (TPR) repeat protein